MENQGSLVWALQFDQKGGAKEVNIKEANKLKTKEGEIVWLNFNRTHSDTLKWLNEESGLDPIIINALVAEETRPRLAEFNEGMLINLRGVNLNEKSSPEDMVSIRIWIEGNRIISLRKRQVMAAIDIKEKLLSGNGPKNIADFVSLFIYTIIDKMEPTVVELNDIIDQIEEKIINNSFKFKKNIIIDIRRKSIILMRYIMPQLEAIYNLANVERKLIDKSHRRKIIEQYDRLQRFLEDLEAIRQRSSAINDEIGNIMSDKLNQNTYILSVMAGIFLPITFLTGLLGVNLAGIPIAYKEISFPLFCLLLLIIAVVQTIVFKRKKWF